MRKLSQGKISVFWKLSVLFCAVCCIILLPGYLKVGRLRKEILEMEKTIEKLRSEKESLRTEMERLEKDPAAVEEIARKLGWVKKGEVRVKFISPDTGALDTKGKKNNRK